MPWLDKVSSQPSKACSLVLWYCVFGPVLWSLCLVGQVVKASASHVPLKLSVPVPQCFNHLAFEFFPKREREREREGGSMCVREREREREV